MKRNCLFFILIMLSGALLFACDTGDEYGEPYFEPAATEAPTEAPTAAPKEQDDEVLIAVPVITERPRVTYMHVEAPTDGQTLMNLIAGERTVETVDIDRGMLSNTDIAMLLSRFPDIAFHYEVQIGYDYILPDAESLSLEDGSVEEILSAAPCLPKLKSVELGACTPDVIEKAVAALPDVRLGYKVRLYGQEVDPDVETLDLSALGTLDPAELSAALPYLPELTTVLLGERNDPDAIKAFCDANPSLDYEYSYTFEYLGMTLTGDTETLDLSGKKIQDVEALKQAIGRMPKLTRVEMIDCIADDETMGALCDAFPDVKFVWEIDLGYWGKLRTDATAFSTRSNKSEKEVKNRLTSERARAIRYCTDLVALDLGHQSLTDISFLQPLKKLRVLIVADNLISDIGVLRELPELEYIELFMNRVSDISPLAGLARLEDLNICSNKIADFSPLYGIKTLRRLWYTKNNYSKSVHERLRTELPDCVLNYKYFGTDGGWRFTGNGNERSEREKWKNAFFEGAPRYE